MSRFRKISAFRRLFLCLALLGGLICCPRALGDEPQLPPAWDVWGEVSVEPLVQAQAAALLDGASGRLLWQRRGFEPLPPASTTKILTALTALDLADMAELCEISPAAAAVGESTIYLRAGERLSLGDLLRGALVRSGNDAAHALAEGVAGSEPLFVSWMNMKAAALGAYSTDFKNTNGLPASGHVVSAVDLAIITRAALADDFFAGTVAQKSVNIGSGTSSRHLQNTNKLLWHDERISGVKTGTTNAAGPCLVASLKDGGRELIAVVFDTPDRYGDCLRLLRWGVARFCSTPLLESGQMAAYLPVKGGEEAGVLLMAEGQVWCAYSEDEAGDLRLKWHLPAYLAAPVRAGQHVGSLRVYNMAGEELANVSLTAARDVAARTLNWRQKLAAWWAR